MVPRVSTPEVGHGVNSRNSLEKCFSIITLVIEKKTFIVEKGKRFSKYGVQNIVV
jgi:hypothetical protein